jgi:hypothetical protein
MISKTETYMIHKKILLFLLLAFFFPLLSYPCDLCGCFVPNETLHHGLQMGIAEQFSSMSDLSLQGEKLANEENQYLNSSYTQLFANYHFNERVALQINVPLIYRSFRRVEGETLERGNESGLGDILLVAYYVPWQRKNPYTQFNWKLVGGLKFPTGNSDRIAEELQENHAADSESSGAAEEVASGVHGHDIALGSGSWDALIGTNIFGRSNRWFYSGQLQYVIRTRGDFNYRYANDLLWYGGPGYYISANPDWPIGFQALLTGEHKGEDQLGSQKTDDTAITSIYLGPTGIFGIKQLAMVEVGLGFPLSLHNSGLQTVPKYRLRLGLTWRL